MVVRHGDLRGRPAEAVGVELHVQLAARETVLEQPGEVVGEGHLSVADRRPVFLHALPDEWKQV
ncbi:MAG: hypothetical protein M5U09_29355, partial [Gammaproteobacteria bacterium]|nr:hypothetical protein [Gammaproteobacteria bacterium]